MNWNEIFLPQTPLLETILRGSIMYLSLFVLLRMVLKRQSSTLGVTDLLVVVLIADASQNAMASDTQSIADSLLLVCVILFWALILDWLGYRVPAIQRFLRPPELLLIKMVTFSGEICAANLSLKMS